MVSALVPRSSGLGSSPGRGHCVVFLGKTLYSHSASLHPGVQVGTDEFNTGGNPAMDCHPIQGGVEIFPVASCYKNQDKLRPGGRLGPYADLTLPLPIYNLFFVQSHFWVLIISAILNHFFLSWNHSQ